LGVDCWAGGPGFTVLRGIGRMGTGRSSALGIILGGSGVTDFDSGHEGGCDGEGCTLRVFLAFRTPRWYFDIETDS